MGARWGSMFEVEPLAEGDLDRADLPWGSELGTLQFRLPPTPHSELEQEPVVSGVRDL